MKNYSQTQSQITTPQPTANGGMGAAPPGLMILALPAVLAIAVVLYKRYRVVKHQHQRETLEQIWKLDYREKTA